MSLVCLSPLSPRAAKKSGSRLGGLQVAQMKERDRYYILLKLKGVFHMSMIKFIAVVAFVSLTLSGCGKDKESADQAASPVLQKLTASQISISRWGPQSIEIGDKSNRRENGDVGIWFEQRGIVSAKDIEIWFGNEKLNTTWYVKPNEVVTLDISANLVTSPGKTQLFIKLPASVETVVIGTLEVKK
jgi:hypothetical protein